MLFNDDPKIDEIKNFTKQELLYKQITRYGYKLFTLTSTTIKLIEEYGPSNISQNLTTALKKEPREVIKNVNFKNPKKNDLYDKTRKAFTFYRIKNLGSVDPKLFAIVEAAVNDLRTIADLHKWYPGENELLHPNLQK